MIQIPKKFMGNRVKGSLERVLTQTAPRPVAETHTFPINTSDLSEYIFVPSIGVYMAKERTHGGLNWYQAHEALHKENKRMPTINEFREFLKYLKENPSGVAGATSAEIQTILDDILTVRDHWRAQWLDADFKVDNKKLYIHYNHQTVGGQLVPQNRELLTDYLTTDKTPGIDLESWIQKASPHGLPPPKIKKGDLYYWAPLKDNNSVAGFGVDSVGADLGCDGHPQDAGGSLGVRSVCEANASPQKI